MAEAADEVLVHVLCINAWLVTTAASASSGIPIGTESDWAAWMIGGVIETKMPTMVSSVACMRIFINRLL